MPSSSPQIAATPDAEFADQVNGRGVQDSSPSESLAPLQSLVGNLAIEQSLTAISSTASLASLLPSLPSLSPCTPATSLLEARILHAFVKGSFLPFASTAFGPVTESLWASYLDETVGIPRPARAFSGPGEIPNGFTAHHKSAEAETEVVNAAAAVLSVPGSTASLPAPGTSTVVPVTSVVPAATLHSRINNASDPMGLDYDSPASTIPGNIAGGIGSGGPPGGTSADPDTRDVDGMLTLTLDPSGTTVTINPSLSFHVHDTVDFCPGALGGLAARVETVPMSVLEATEGRFGPVFAADVPFDVDYPGPGTAVATATLPPPSPTPPPAPTPTPSPTPSMPTSYTVVPGDSLWKIAATLCGDPLKWQDIYAANRAVIGPDPNLIYPGQVLTIPCAP